jgi:hypothetical protein
VPPAIGVPWPAPALSLDVQRRHVDVIDVGTLLAVHLDADELLVQNLRDVLVVERLALHDVAPVAGAVADRQEDHLALFLGLLEGLGAPGVPVHRIMGVLQQVGAALARQAVGRALFRVLLRLVRRPHAADQRQDRRRHGQPARKVSPHDGLPI